MNKPWKRKKKCIPKSLNFPEVFQAKCFNGSNCLSLPNLEPTHIASVLSRLTRSPVQKEKQSNIFKACSWDIYFIP
jgi:hypothetical protein